MGVVLIPTQLHSTVTGAVLVGTILLGVKQGDVPPNGDVSLDLLLRAVVICMSCPSSSRTAPSCWQPPSGEPSHAEPLGWATPRVEAAVLRGDGFISHGLERL